ncbi:GAF domain-containing protein [Alsobacter sp. R-9]
MSITELAERRRLEALRDLGVVPFLPDAVFDHVAEVARSHFDVPVALVTILTRDDQIFAGRQGLAMQGTPREIAFCDHTIRSDDVMVVHDALEDPRFRGNPLVLGEPHIRFYAGAPLVLGDGVRVGSLCIIDRKPRGMTLSETLVLKNIAHIALNELKQFGARAPKLARGA